MSYVKIGEEKHNEMATEQNTSLVDGGHEQSPNKAVSLAPKDLWAWFKKDPCSRWPLIFFLTVLLLSLIFLIVYPINSNDALYGSGVVVTVMSIFGAYHFRILMSLKEQVDHFKKLNAQFKKEHVAMKQEISKMENANQELVATEARLSECNTKNRENLTKFRQLSENLSKFGGGNSEGMKKVQQDAAKMKTKWEEQLIRHERDILSKVFDQVELKDGDADMTESEFKTFLEMLPLKYQERFSKLGIDFAQIAGDDQKMDIKEFTQLLDKWARDFALK